MVSRALWIGCWLALLTLPNRVTADDAAPVEAAELQLAEVEITDSVRVETTGNLRSDRDGRLFTGLTVVNSTEEPIAGRIVVVIDDTGIAGLNSAVEDGHLTSGEAYRLVLPLTAELPAGERTTSIRIDFVSEARISAKQRADLALRTRVFRVGAELPAGAEPVADDNEQNLPGKSYSQARLDQVMAIQNKYTEQLLAQEGVLATATAEDDEGNLVVQVYTQRLGIKHELPGELDGVPVQTKVTGTMFRARPATDRVVEIDGRKRAMPRPEAPALEPVAESEGQATADPALAPVPPGTPLPFNPADPNPVRPIPIGVSIFNFQDLCASGTLGCRIVFPDGKLGILTNGHVGSMEDRGTAEDLANSIQGNDITQPGCGDAPIAILRGNIFATLVDFQTFNTAAPNPTGSPTSVATTQPNSIDAAIARINGPDPASVVLARTPPGGYGFPSQEIVAPRLGMKVVKYGRTTGYREGTIEGINLNTIVGYTFNGPVYFTGQIAIVGDHMTFGQPGDSGSLIVTKEGNHPVGLLFAGSGLTVLANPIDLVIERFNIAIDDGSGTFPNPAANRTPGSRGSGRMGRAGGKLEP
ncbi:MAG: hypothetical protein R3B90_07565 [Planctomycetaceae bacterium]